MSTLQCSLRTCLLNILDLDDFTQGVLKLLVRPNPSLTLISAHEHYPVTRIITIVLRTIRTHQQKHLNLLRTLFHDFLWQSSQKYQPSAKLSLLYFEERREFNLPSLGDFRLYL